MQEFIHIFFVRSVKNAKKNECGFIENDAFKRKKLSFLRTERKIAGVSMQKMAALSNNFGDGAPKNDVFYRGNVFWKKKYKCAY